MPFTVVLRKETGGRRGKTVTLVSGLAPLGDAKIAALASDLKRRCGAGGSVEPGGVVLIQGDQLDRVEEDLVARGWTVKRK
jgi:translation initiation factor 1